MTTTHVTLTSQWNSELTDIGATGPKSLLYVGWN